MKRSSKVWPISLGAVLVILASLLAGAWIIVVRPLRTRYAEQSRQLDEAVTDFHQQRWARPILRGEERDGNAFEAQQAAVTSLAVLPDELLERAIQRLDEGNPLGAEVLALIARHRDDLDTYRASTQRAWAWGDFSVEGPGSAVQPDFLTHLQAARWLRLEASLSQPDECLEIATDVIRLGQDRAVGRSMVALMIHHVGVREIFEELAICLNRASPQRVAQASRELGVLAQHPAPIGYTMEIEAHYAGATFAQQLQALSGLPRSRLELRIWWEASDTLSAWAELAGAPTDRRRIGEDYPADITRYEAWVTAMRSSSNPVLATGVPELGRFLRRDASTKMRIRMLWAYARLRSGEPRALFLDPRLHDPLTGAPFETRETSAGLELRSPGEDGIWGRVGYDGEVDDLSLFLPLDR